MGPAKIETVNPKNSQIQLIEYVVVSDGHVPILGVQAIQLFNIMTVNNENIMSVNHQDSTGVIDEFQDFLNLKEY